MDNIAKHEDVPPPLKQPPAGDDIIAPPITARQVAFDIIFGVVAPILAVLFDPVVFHQFGCIGPIIPPRFHLTAYAAIGIGALTLAVWHAVTSRSPRWSAFAYGVLTLGFFMALLLGVVLLPFSVPGIVYFGVGLLGFLPFAAAYAYARNAFRAFRAAVGQGRVSWQFAVTAVAGALVVIILLSLVWLSGIVLPVVVPGGGCAAY